MPSSIRAFPLLHNSSDPRRQDTKKCPILHHLLACFYLIRYSDRAVSSRSFALLHESSIPGRQNERKTCLFFCFFSFWCFLLHWFKLNKSRSLLLPSKLFFFIPTSDLSRRFFVSFKNSAMSSNTLLSLFQKLTTKAKLTSCSSSSCCYWIRVRLAVALPHIYFSASSHLSAGDSRTGQSQLPLPVVFVLGFEVDWL